MELTINCYITKGSLVTYKNVNKEFSKQLDQILNVVCSICGDAYMTDFELVQYCDPCIAKLEDEIS